MRKLLSIIFVLLIFLFVPGCEYIDNPTELDYVVLPNLSGLTREQIDAKLKDKDINYTYYIENHQYFSENEYDKFICYGGNLRSGNKVEKGYNVAIYTTALPLPTEPICDVEMDFSYEGLDFVVDGIGEVTLSRSIDGDTAHFYTKNGTYVKVRFLGVDTPESTIEHEAWGKAASTYTKNRLENATTIVLESEGNREDAYGRYLAFIWVDGELLNLELVQNAYSNCKLSGTSKYFNAFFETEAVISKTGRRFWGEIDPDYDYKKNDFK